MKKIWLMSINERADRFISNDMFTCLITDLQCLAIKTGHEISQFLAAGLQPAAALGNAFALCVFSPLLIWELKCLQQNLAESAQHCSASLSIANIISFFRQCRTEQHIQPWTSLLSGHLTRSKNFKTPFFKRYYKFLPWGHSYRSRTSPIFFF